MGVSAFWKQAGPSSQNPESSQAPQQGETRTLCCCVLRCKTRHMDRQRGPTGPLHRGGNAIITTILFPTTSKRQAPQPEPERPSSDFGSGGGHACPFDPGRAPMYRVLRLPTIHLGESRRGRQRVCPRPRRRVAVLCNLYLGELSVPVDFWKHSDLAEDVGGTPHRSRPVSLPTLLQV